MIESDMYDDLRKIITRIEKSVERSRKNVIKDE
ncbi:hypothetical protein [Borrelia crocidurae]